jgi:hypothetical protein
MTLAHIPAASTDIRLFLLGALPMDPTTKFQIISGNHINSHSKKQCQLLSATESI